LRGGDFIIFNNVNPSGERKESGPQKVIHFRHPLLEAKRGRKQTTSNKIEGVKLLKEKKQ